MKSLYKYIIESSEAKRFKPTVKKLEELYTLFNERYFNNELPKKIKLYCRDGLVSQLGCQGFEKHFCVSKKYTVNGMYQMFDKIAGYKSALHGRGYKWVPVADTNSKVTNCEQLNPYIEINTKYEFSELELEDTLIHEMVHLWVSKDGLEPKRAHGKEFTKKCTEVRNLARSKYNTKYNLGTKAAEDGDYGLSKEEAAKADKELKDSIEKATKTGVLSVYIAYAPTPITDKSKISSESVIFCTKKVLEKIWDDITYGRNNIYTIQLSKTGYQEMCKKLNERLPKQTTYKYYDLNQFGILCGGKKEARDIICKDAFSPSEIGLSCKMYTDKPVTEAKENKNKPQDEMEGMLCVNAPVGDVNIEDILNKADELIDKENEEDKPVKGLELKDGKKK